jgi:hypothetical protein
VKELTLILIIVFVIPQEQPQDSFENTSNGIITAKISPTYFESRLRNIIDTFKENILSESSCINTLDDLDSISEDIEEELEKNDKYSSSQMAELKKIDKEVDAAIDLVYSIGNCNTLGHITIEDFNLINNKVNARVTDALRESACVDIYALKINEYVAFLAVNESDKLMSVSIDMDSEYSYGNMSMGLDKGSMRRIHDNFDEIRDVQVDFSNIDCTISQYNFNQY